MTLQWELITVAEGRSQKLQKLAGEINCVFSKWGFFTPTLLTLVIDIRRDLCCVNDIYKNINVCSYH